MERFIVNIDLYSEEENNILLMCVNNIYNKDDDWLE